MSLLLAAASHSNGQGTLLLDLDALPSGQTLAEQFAGAGVHFIPRGALPVTTDVAPDFLPSGSGTVGRAIAFGVRFDQPITLLEFDIAQAHKTFEPLPHSPNYQLYAFDNSGHETFPYAGAFPEEQWHHVRTTYSPDQGITSIRLEGWVSAGENFTQEIFFDNIKVTFVPEPGTITLLTLGAAGLFSFMRRRGAGTKPANS